MPRFAHDMEWTLPKRRRNTMGTVSPAHARQVPPPVSAAFARASLEPFSFAPAAYTTMSRGAAAPLPTLLQSTPPTPRNAFQAARIEATTALKNSAHLGHGAAPTCAPPPPPSARSSKTRRLIPNAPIAATRLEARHRDQAETPSNVLSSHTIRTRSARSRVVARNGAGGHGESALSSTAVATSSSGSSDTNTIVTEWVSEVMKHFDESSSFSSSSKPKQTAAAPSPSPSPLPGRMEKRRTTAPAASIPTLSSLLSTSLHVNVADSPHTAPSTPSTPRKREPSASAPSLRPRPAAAASATNRLCSSSLKSAPAPPELSGLGTFDLTSRHSHGSRKIAYDGTERSSQIFDAPNPTESAGSAAAREHMTALSGSVSPRSGTVSVAKPAEEQDDDVDDDDEEEEDDDDGDFEEGSPSTRWQGTEYTAPSSLFSETLEHSSGKLARPLEAPQQEDHQLSSRFSDSEDEEEHVRGDGGKPARPRKTFWKIGSDEDEEEEDDASSYARSFASSRSRYDDDDDNYGDDRGASSSSRPAAVIKSVEALLKQASAELSSSHFAHDDLDGDDRQEARWAGHDRRGRQWGRKKLRTMVEHPIVPVAAAASS